jgi:hypothetical protein
VGRGAADEAITVTVFIESGRAYWQVDHLYKEDPAPGEQVVAIGIADD